MGLPAEVEASYAAIIDKILAKSDIETISVNKIRRGLQDEIGYDVSHQKAELKALIMSRFDKLNSDKLVPAPEPQQTPAKPLAPVPEPAPVQKQALTNGHVAPPKPVKQESPSLPRPNSASPNGYHKENVVEEGQPPAKKKKKSEELDADAVFAARLQAEENSRARPTRHAATSTKKSSSKKRKSPSKKKSRAKAEDDSEIDSASSAEPKRKVNRSGGFHKQLTLSPSLGEFLEETALSRPETVKRIWAYVREHDLQDPNDKRQIRCDDALKTIFKQERVHMFTMNKILSGHLFEPDE